jgi:hypothetical protein
MLTSFSTSQNPDMAIPETINKSTSKEDRTQWWTAHPIDSVAALLDLPSAYPSSPRRPSDVQPDDDLASSSDSQLGDDDDDEARPDMMVDHIGIGKPGLLTNDRQSLKPKSTWARRYTPFVPHSLYRTKQQSQRRFYIHFPGTASSARLRATSPWRQSSSRAIL